MRLPRRSFRRFALSVLISAAVILLIFFIANTRVNPLWVSKAPWTDESYADFRPIYRFQRTGKAGIARSKPWKVAFLGSSRIDIAFDPALPQWGDKPTVNLAVSAGTIPETAAILRYPRDHAPLETAIAGIDIGDLMGSSSPYKTTGFMESPFNPNGDHMEQEFRYYAGISTFKSAVQTIDSKSKNELPEYTPLGHRLRPKQEAEVAKVIRRDGIPHALRVSRRRKSHPPGMEPNADKAKLVQQMLDDTKAHKCRLVFVIPPSHGAYLGVFHYVGDPDPVFSGDRHALVKLVAASNAAHPDAPPATIWDFNDFHPLNCEPLPADKSKMHWWLDGTHSRKALGDVMLSRIMGWPIEGEGKDYGFELNESNLHERAQNLREGYQHFKDQNPELWNWMVEGINTFQSTGDAKGSSEADEQAPDF